MYRLSTLDPNAEYPDNYYVKERYWFDAYGEKEIRLPSCSVGDERRE